MRNNTPIFYRTDLFSKTLQNYKHFIPFSILLGYSLRQKIFEINFRNEHAEIKKYMVN